MRCVRLRNIPLIPNLLLSGNPAAVNIPSQRRLAMPAMANLAAVDFRFALRAGKPQQVRKYAPAAQDGNAGACWNCRHAAKTPAPSEEDHKKSRHMLCESCGHLQDVDMAINYFELLSCPQCFDVEPQTLTRHFRQLQTLVHPDKFSKKSAREQANSADWSSLINKAYATLATPIERGQYLLQLHGQQLPADNSALNKIFLLEMMERNEEVEEANTSEQLERLNDTLNRDLGQKTRALSKRFKARELDEAKAIMIEMKYLLSIQKTVKKKLQALMTAGS